MVFAKWPNIGTVFWATVTECSRIRACWKFPAAWWPHVGAMQEYERYPSPSVCLVTRRLRSSSSLRPFVLVCYEFNNSINIIVEREKKRYSFWTRSRGLRSLLDKFFTWNLCSGRFWSRAFVRNHQAASRWDRIDQWDLLNSINLVLNKNAANWQEFDR